MCSNASWINSIALRPRSRASLNDLAIVHEPIIVLDAMLENELVEKLAALVPPPRFHLVRYHGVLGPCASERDRIVPVGEGARQAQSAPRPELDATRDHVQSDPACAATPATPDSASIEMLGSMRERELLATPPPIAVASVSAPARPDASRARRLAWAELMTRVFAIDVLECPRCRGPMRLAVEPRVPRRQCRIAPQRRRPLLSPAVGSPR
jgi:hypothetical protein